MNLCIDLGNTFAKTGLFDGLSLVEMNAKLTYEELKGYVLSKCPEKIIICSVSVSEEQLKELLTGLSAEVILLKHSTKIPISNNYETPETLGMDRIAAAVGAQSIFPNMNVIIIDMGTCIKYDLLDASGAFQGGIISPGMRMRFKAMHTFTKRLPLLEASEIPPLLGKNTQAAMQSGVVNGIIAELNGIIEQYQQVLTNFNVVFTGGDAAFFETRIKYPNFVIPELILQGLNRILIHNVEHK